MADRKSIDVIKVLLLFTIGFLCMGCKRTTNINTVQYNDEQKSLSYCIERLNDVGGSKGDKIAENLLLIKYGDTEEQISSIFGEHKYKEKDYIGYSWSYDAGGIVYQFCIDFIFNNKKLAKIKILELQKTYTIIRE